MLANPTQVVSVAVLIITIASITTTEDTLHTVANPTCKASSSEYAARGPQRIEEDKQTNKQTNKQNLAKRTHRTASAQDSSQHDNW